MAKKKKTKVIQMLSPEKYIKLKARALPIYECCINNDWRENRLANITVARKHTNGNLTIGLYLVDLDCLGIKDSWYHFNIPDFEYQEILKHMKETMEIGKISYELAHNIIFSGLEFAEEYGFKPHKFFAVARYVLEEDTDKIELIEIECGENNKPVYVQGPLDNDATARQIIAHLEKHAGPGNYNYILKDEVYPNQDINDDEGFEDEDFEDILKHNFNKKEVNNSYTLQFKIQIDGITEPSVWRRITVPSYYSFMHLHYVIQAAFGWTNSHLFLYSENGFESESIITRIYEYLDPGDQLQVEARETKISDVFKNENQTLDYIYDYGDSWEHKITLEKITNQISMHASCLDGKGKCPPEDCGSTSGFSNMKEILKNPLHPEYESYIEWLGLQKGQTWNPNEFDINKTQNYLRGLFTIT